MNEAISNPNNLWPDDLATVTALIDNALLSGFLVGVHDGEEWSLLPSHNRTALLAAVGTTDEDMLRIYTVTRKKLGDVMLAYGNRDGTTIRDHTDSTVINALVSAAESASTFVHC